MPALRQDPAPRKDSTMTTSARTPARTWLRRVLLTTVTCILGLATLAGIVLAGATVTSRSTHQPAPPYLDGRSHDVAPARRARPRGGPHRCPRSTARRRVRRGHERHRRQRPPRAVRHLRELARVQRPTSSPTTPPRPPRGRAARRSDVHVRRRRRRPQPEARPGRGARTRRSRKVPTEAPLRSWVARQHDDGARVLGVCSGSLVLAATGMLDGLHATSHWSRISALEAEPTGGALAARAPVRRGRVRHHHGRGDLRGPGSPPPGR